MCYKPKDKNYKGMAVSRYPTFKRAPIAEALLEIRCVLPGEVTLERIEEIHQQVKHRFPDKAKRMSVQATFKLPSPEGPESEPGSSTRKMDGFLFRSTDTGKIFQARLDGFTFNKLKPYESWDSFSAEARELWNVYLQHLKPSLVSRLALRYINKVNIPLPLKDFKEYFLTVPEIAPELPQSVAGFFLQLALPFPEHNCNATIIETIEQTVADSFTLIFDIDAFSEASFDPNDAGIWEQIERLRAAKNDVFMKTFTDKAKELFS